MGLGCMSFMLGIFMLVSGVMGSVMGWGCSFVLMGVVMLGSLSLGLSMDLDVIILGWFVCFLWFFFFMFFLIGVVSFLSFENIGVCLISLKKCF